MFFYRRGWSFFRVSMGRVCAAELSLGPAWALIAFVHFVLGDDATEHHNAQVGLGLPRLFAFYFSFTIPFLGREFVRRVTGKKLRAPYPRDLAWSDYALRGPLYTTLGGHWPREWSLNLCLDNGGCVSGPLLSLRLGSPRRGWTRGNWQWSWFVLDHLLGRHVYTSEVIYADDDRVVMPEGAYPCTVEITVDRWKRPRWPRTLTRVRYAVRMCKGAQIPFPGKGENSWDCGMDARFAESGALLGVTEAEARSSPRDMAILAIEQVRAGVERDRDRNRRG